MSTEVIEPQTDRLLPFGDGGVPSAVESAVGTRQRELAPNTQRLYASDWARFARFCTERARPALPAGQDTVVAFLHEETSGRAALARRLAAIDHRHRQFGMVSPADDPVVRRALRQARAVAPRRKRVARPTGEALKRLALRCPRDLAGLRDRALLLLLAAGLSRREVVGLQAERLRFSEDGVDVSPDHSAARVLRSPRHDLCPVRALEAWLRASDMRYGPVFRKVTRWGTVEPHALGADAVRLILARRGS